MTPSACRALDRRAFLKSSSLAVAGAGLWTLPVAAFGPAEAPGSPRVQRLTWAGLKIEMEDTTLLIDPIITDIWQGNRSFSMVTPEINTERRYVLLTHLHNDHYDRAAVAEALGERGRVVCHEGIVEEVASDGFRVRPAAHYEPIRLGAFIATALPAVDGLGVKGGQVSWAVRGGGKTFFHGGDTLWHGHWRLFQQQYGPFDAAYLPINGFQLQGMEPPSTIAASMTPEQAVAAGVLLGARVVTPIHYGVNDPEFYVEYPEAEGAFIALAQERELEISVLAPGEWAAGRP